MIPNILLEVAVASLTDVQVADKNGADRLELNAALALGGLTPSLGLLREARAVTTLPLVVLLRPRASGFHYSDDEFRVLLADLELALEHGADAIAFGILTSQGTIDQPRCAEVLRRTEQVRKRSVVFHRAFDVVPDPLASLEVLVDLGIQRVMTSGQETSALRGASLIARLVEQAAGRLEILPAGGINGSTVSALVNQTGCNQVHASVRELRPDRSTAARPQVRYCANVWPEEHFEATNAEAVRELRRILG